jgi:sugar lactone lactonase YvrE
MVDYINSMPKSQVDALDEQAVNSGICLDAEGAVWYGDVPNKRCMRVREGSEVLQAIALDRGCFACMLGVSPVRQRKPPQAQESKGSR